MITKEDEVIRLVSRAHINKKPPKQK